MSEVSTGAQDEDPMVRDGTQWLSNNPATPESAGDLVERLRKPIAADSIYDWIVQKRKQTTSDLPRQGFCNEMELIDEQRTEAADMISTLRTQLAERDETIAGLREALENIKEGAVKDQGMGHSCRVPWPAEMAQDIARQALTPQVPHG